MATNKYVNTTLAAGGKVLPGAGAPGRVFALIGTYEKTALDNDTSVLRLGKVPINAIPLPHSYLGNDALTGATDVDIGVYKPNGPGVTGAEIDKDVLSDGLNIASGAALGSEARAFQAIGLDKFGLTLRDLISGQDIGENEEVDIAITGNTFGTATGTIAWELFFLIPQS